MTDALFNSLQKFHRERRLQEANIKDIQRMILEHEWSVKYGNNENDSRYYTRINMGRHSEANIRDAVARMNSINKETDLVIKQFLPESGIMCGMLCDLELFERMG